MLKLVLHSLLPLFCCGAATLHVDVAARPGGDGSSTRPYRTIQQAADRVLPGDTVIIAPGVYFETVRLRRFGRENAPITFRADKIRKNRVIVTGADPEVRRGQRKWQLYDRATGTYVLDYDHSPARILYSGTDLFGYRSLESLLKFEAKPGVPGPKHGFFQRDGKLFVRLRADGKYGPADPNRHIMALSPPTAPYGDEENPDSRAYNFALLGRAGEELHVVIDGLTFETPGRTAIYVSGNRVTVRNSLFLGCQAGGVIGRVVNSPAPNLKRASNEITVEFCEWHAFPLFDDVKELIQEVKSGKVKVPPKDRLFHWWVHKSRANGVANSYETGIVRQVGRNWTIRNCYIHDCFDGLANLNYGENTIFENNLFERCVDNAIETENHARNCHIRRNRFVDVYQSISVQPLDGPPWPGPVYVYQNLFSRTRENLIWGGGGGSFKIGIQSRQWNFPQLNESMKAIDPAHISLPGLLVFNNTIIDPNTRLVVELGGATQKLDNIAFYNNLAIAANIRHPRAADGDGGATHYNFVNNRFCWRASRTSDIPKLRGQLRPPQEKLLLDETENRFLPVKFEPAVPVPGAPEQFRYIGALQSPEQRIADRVGVQEER